MALLASRFQREFHARRSPFTLVELLMVFAIICILMSLLLPVVIGMQKKARYSRWLASQTNRHADASLVGYWSFEDKKGTTLSNQARGLEVENYFETSLDGTMTNNPVWAEGRWPGKGALYFDGSNDYVNCGNHPALDLRNSLSIAVWAYHKPGNFSILLSRGGWAGTSNGYALFWWGNTIYAVLRSGAATQTWVSTTAPSDNTWHNIGLTWDRNSTTATLYFDGKAVKTGSFTGPIGAPIANMTFRIGVSQDSAGSYFKGFIDEVAVYERALNASEMNTIYLMGAP